MKGKHILLICCVILTCFGVGFLLGTFLLQGGNNEWEEQYELGVKYLSEGKYEQAIVAFSAAISIDPYQIPAYMCRAESYISSAQSEKDYQKALQDYDTILGLDETTTDAWVNAAELTEKLLGQESALALLNEGLDKAKDSEIIVDKISLLKEKTETSIISHLGVNYLADILGMDKDTIIATLDEEVILNESNGRIDSKINLGADDTIYTFWCLSLAESHIGLNYTDNSKTLHMHGQSNHEIFEISIPSLFDYVSISDGKKYPIARGIIPQMTVNEVLALDGCYGYQAEELGGNLENQDPRDEGVAIDVTSNQGWHIRFVWTSKIYNVPSEEYIYSHVDRDNTLPTSVTLMKQYE